MCELEALTDDGNRFGGRHQADSHLLLVCDRRERIDHFPRHGCEIGAVRRRHVFVKFNAR